MIRLPFDDPLRGPVGSAVADAVWNPAHDPLLEPVRAMLVDEVGEVIVAPDGAVIAMGD